jgi:hypothetical protein
MATHISRDDVLSNYTEQHLSVARPAFSIDYALTSRLFQTVLAKKIKGSVANHQGVFTLSRGSDEVDTSTDANELILTPS